MQARGRVVGDPTEEPWTDKDGKEHIQRKLSIVDETMRSVIEVAIREEDWIDAAQLRDNQPCTVEITRVTSDRYGRLRYYGKVAA